MGNATKQKTITAITRAINSKYRPLVVIFICWLVFSSPYFLKGLVPFPSKYLVSFFPPWNASYGMPVKNNAMPDLISQIYPWKLLTIRSWKNGEIPLWNPYSFSGTVHAGNYQSAVFSPVNAVFFFLPFIDAWSIMILLQPLLAGIFMYAFLVSLGLSLGGITIGSVAFMFSGFMTTWMAYGTLGYAVLWLPLILFSVERYIQRSNPLYGIITSLAVMCSLVSGHFQISGYIVFLSGLYITYRAWITKTMRVFLYMSACLLLGLVLAAPQLLLTYGAFTQTVRMSYFVKNEVIPWKYILTILAPDFYGNPVTRNDWFGHYAEWSVYIGVLPFLMSLYAVFHTTRRRFLFFILAFVGAILLSYDTIFSSLLYLLRIPVYSTSAAGRIIVISSFSLAVLASYGVSVWMADCKNKDRKTSILLGIAGFMILLAVWIIASVNGILPADKAFIARRNLILPTGFTISTLALLFLGFIPRLRKIALFGLIIVTAFDMVRFAVKWMPFDPKEYVYPENKTISYLTSNAGINRIYGNLGGEVGTAFNLQLIEGYDTMYQGRYGRFIQSASGGIPTDAGKSTVLLDKKGKYTGKLLSLLGVKHIVHRLSDGRNIWAYPYWEYPPDVMKSVYRDDDYEIFSYSESYPRVFLASKYILSRTEEEIAKILFTSEIDLRNTLVLEEKPGIEPSDGDGTVKILSYKSNSVILKTESESPKLLFLSDVYDNGWKAYIDGRQAPIYRADYVFRSVAVPSGIHTISFFYRPLGYTAGVILSIIGLLSMFSLYFIMKKYEDSRI